MILYATQFLGNCVEAKSPSVSPALTTIDVLMCQQPSYDPAIYDGAREEGSTPL